MNKKAKAFKYHRRQHLYHTVTYTNNNYNIASKFVYSNSIARACFIFLLRTLMTSANISLKTKNFPSGWKCYKTIGLYVSCTFIEIWSTWEVKRVLKKLEPTPRATLTHLLCSPNFPRASDLDERTLTYEPLVKFSRAKLRQLIQLAFGVARQQHYCNDIGLKLNLNLFRWPFVGLWTPIRSGVIERDYIHRVTVTGEHFSKVPVTIQARRGPLYCSVFIPDGGFKGFGNETKKLSAKKGQMYWLGCQKLFLYC